jgi:PAS domain S-box-containing protein
MATLSTIVLIIIASVIVTDRQIAQISQQQNISGNIEQMADELNNIQSQYLLFQAPKQLTLWQSNVALILANFSTLKTATSEQKTLAQNAKNDLGQLNESFTNVVQLLEVTPENVSFSAIPEFQNAWNQMMIAQQTFASNAAQLSESLRIQGDQLAFTNILLIIALLAVFVAFLTIIYIITYRRTLKSISNLQTGINVVGSGNLDYAVNADKKDEIGDLSSSFNQMTSNLKTVTTSKIELERQVAERKKLQDKLEEYAKNLEGLVEERTKSLESSALYARSLIEASLDPLVTISAKGKITDVNKATEIATGSSRKELIDSDFSDYFTEPDKARFGYKKAFLDGFVRDYPLAIRHKSGKVIPVLYNAVVYRNEVGDVQGVFAAARDVTELKKAEEQAQESERKLRDSERLAAIGATAGMVGHDIRNPLQSILGELYLAQEDVASLQEGEVKESLKESINTIEENISYVNKIVADLQDFAKPLRPVFEILDLENVIDGVLLQQEFPENIRAESEVKREAKRFIGDKAFVKRIIGNLVSNAVQAMPSGGKLSIRAHAEANEVLIEVEDTGVGIPDSVGPRLFTPLFTTKSKGQGFGLAVVKRMTEALNGKVTFESQEGKGTKFIVHLPPKEQKDS